MENCVWGRKFCVSLLRACTQKKDLLTGTKVHADVLKRGLHEKSSYVATTLVNMYAKCGDLTKAKLLLDGLPHRDVFAWNALIAGYAQQGKGDEALQCFRQMQSEGVSPDEITFTCVLKSCGSTGATDLGEEIHDEIVRQGLLGKDVVLGNALVDMYAKCGALVKARKVLDELPSVNVVSWNALIGGYAQRGYGEEALACFDVMQGKGFSPDAVTFACALKACASIQAVTKGKQIHEEVAKQGLLRKDVVLGNALLDIYAKCGLLKKAREVLFELPIQSVVSWNTLIGGYVQYEQGQEALLCFEEMQHKGFLPTAVTFTCALKACGSIGALKKGEEIHDDIVRQEMLNSSIALGNALVDMYSKCGEVAKAQCVLDELPSRNVTSWNALIAGYAQHGPYEDALKCYDRMWHEGLTPSIMTFIYVLKACGSIGAIDKGEEIHDEIVGQGLLNKDCVEVNACLCNALVDMYATCGTLLKAQHLLEGLHIRDVVSWNTIIGGYARQGKGEEALNCLNLMQRKGIPPDAITFTCILKACGSVGAADKGEGIHDEIVRQGLLEKDSLLGNALVDMYAKCGVLQKARQVLEALPVGDAVSWNALLGGYAQQGKGEDALDCFECMQHKGLAPNAITFSSMLNACSHSGLLEEGQTCFVNMCIEYGIVPELEHYSCMVDLFGRAGRFNKAVALIEKMPSAGYPTVWAALLGACRKWGDVSVARWAFEHAIEIDKSDTPFYVCMANIFAATTRQEDMQIDNNSSTVTNKTWRKGRGGLWNELCDSRTEFLDASLCHARTDYFDVKLPYLQVC